MSDNPFALSNIQRDSEGAARVNDNPFSLANIERDQQAELRGKIKSAVTVNPDQAAEADKLAKRYPVPQDVLARNLLDVKMQAAVDDADAALQTSPKLARALREKPWLAQQSHDDIGTLAQIEQFFRDTGGSVKAGVFNASKGAAGVFRAGTELAARLPIVSLLDYLEPVTAVGGNPLRRFAEGFDLLAQQNEASAKAATPKTEGNISSGFQSGIQSLTQNTLMLPLAFLPGGQPAALAGMTAFTGGQSYQDARDKGLPMTQALPFAASQAAIEYATEKLPLGQLIGDVKAGTPFLKTLAKQIALEVPGEQVATILQDLNEWAVLNPEKPFSSYLEARPSAAAQTLVATIVGAGGNVAIAKGIESVMQRGTQGAAEIENAERAGKNIERAMNMALQSKLRERNPETFKQLVQQLADEDGGTPASVFIDGDILLQAVQGMDQQALAQAFPSLADQLNVAASSGGVVELPIGEVLTAVPGTPLEQVFLQNMRANENALSLAEAKQAADQAEQFVKTEADRAMAEAADQQAWAASAETVKTTILDQLNTAGRFTSDVNEAYATLVRDFYAVTASRQGITPEEMYARYPLRVGAQAQTAGPQLEQVLPDFASMRDKIAQQETLNAQRPEGHPLRATGERALARLKSEYDAATAKHANTLAKLEGSKLVDARGNPLVVYHGGGPGIANTGKFKRKDGGRALWFSNTQVAGTYAGNAEGSTMYPVLPVAKNPLVFDANGATWRELTFEGERLSTDDLAEIAEQRGHDALVIKNLRDENTDDGGQEAADHIALFKPEQAVSAITGETLAQSAPFDGPETGSTPIGDATEIEVDGKMRPALNSKGQPIHSTLEGVRNFWRWFGDSKVVDDQGRPLVVYHGTAADFDSFDNAKTGANDRGMWGRGHYFAASAESANSYALRQGDGAKVIPTYVSLKNPLVLKTGGDLVTRLPDGTNVKELVGQNLDGAKVKAMALAGGHDGVIQYRPNGLIGDMVAYNPTQIKSATGNSGAFSGQDANILRQDQQRDLVITHNLTADNLLHAVKLGGIAVPSLAVTKKDNPLTGFGEITLIGSPEMADPKGYAGTKVFGADIYSPRYPSVERELDKKGVQALVKELKPMTDKLGIRDPYGQDLERNGQRELERNLAVVATFLQSKGIEPTVVQRGGMEPARRARLKQFGMGPFMDATSTYDLLDNPEFINAAVAEVADSYEQAGMGDLVAKILGNEDSQRNIARDTAQKIVNDAKLRKRPEADGYATKMAMEKQIAEADLANEFQQFVADKLDSITKSERIFQGFTNSGNRKYIPHTLENVVKILKKELRGGENLNYGVGSLRAKFTPQFKSVAEIRKNKDRLISAADFDKIKDDINNEFLNMASAMGIPSETLSAIMEDAAKMGVQRAAAQYEVDVGGDRSVQIAEFMTRLRNLPTAYFEAKVLREVDLAEFAGAVVPEGVNPEVIKALQDRGVKNIRTYKKGDEADRAARIGEFENLFFQNARGTFSPSQLAITLNENADLSTFLHESGHFFLEVMADLASQPNAPADVADDMGALLKWFGVADTATWQGMTLDQKRPYHEKFAESFEQYLLEGKAPNTELQPLFRKFRSWMLNIYKSLTQFMRGRDLQLSDDVRQVFDRMLATDEQIKQAEEAAGLLPNFEATNEAIEKLQARSLRDLKWAVNARNRFIKKLQKEAAALRKDVEAEVRAEVEAMPVYAAQEAIARIKGEASAEQLETIAETVGYTSASQMLAEIATAGSKASAIEGMTDQRMLERHGDLVDQRAIEEAANEAVHNEARARSLATELKAQSDALNPRRQTGVDVNGRPVTVNALVEAAKQFAQNLTARRKVKDLKSSARQHRAAEARAGKRWQEATAAGKTEEAIAAKRDQLLNNYTTKALLEVDAEVRKIVDYLAKFDKDTIRKKLPAEYLDQIDALRENMDLRTSVTGRELERRASLRKWVESQQAMGLDPIVPDELLDAANRVSYKEMTVEELRAMRDVVKNIEHLGRLKSKLLAAKDKREFDAVAEAWSQEIRTNGGKPKPVKLEGDSRIVKFFKGAWADHRKLNSLIRQFAGGADNSEGFKALIRSMNERGTQEDVMIEKAAMDLAEIHKPIEKLPGGFSGAKLFIPEINNSLTRAGRLSVALNWGNEQNRQRLRDGDNWSDAQVEAILRTLTPTELTFVNDVWEYLDSYWPEVKAKQERVSGVVEEKVEAEPFVATAADGTLVPMRGGYYPIKYDGDRSLKSQKQEAEQLAKDMLRGAVLRPSTRRGHTKARVDEVVGRPIKKDLSVITQHVTQVVHDLAWHEWAIDANRLMNDPRIASAVRDHYGAETHRAMTDAVEAIVVGDVAKQSSIDQLLLKMRANVTRSIMGASLTTALLQPFGLTQSMARIGVVPVLKGAGRWAGDAARMESTVNWVREKSNFMRLRSKTFNRELREISQRVQGKSKFMQVADASLFMLMQKLQMVADIPTWVGAYEKALNSGLDEATAVQLADEAVLSSQGGGNTRDLSAVQRDLPFLTQFYGYFNTTLNLVAEKTATTDFRNPRAAAGWVGDMLLLVTIPAILPALITFALKGGGEDDDPEKWAKRLAEWQAGYMLGMFVGLRELPALWSPFDYGGPPAAKLINDGRRLVQQANQGEVDDQAVLATIGFLGTALGLPTTQVIRSYKGWLAWDEGNAPPSSILFGPPPKD